MKITIGNDLHDDVVTRDMTEDEIKNWRQAAKEGEANEIARENKQNAAASARAKLAALGLNNDEITAIIGG